MEQICFYKSTVPQSASLEDKPDLEQLNLISQLDEDDKQTIFKIIDTMPTIKKFNDFFQKNVAAL